MRFFPVERHDSTEENLISVTFLSADLANLVLFFLAREVFASEHRICSRNVASILERVNKKNPRQKTKVFHQEQTWCIASSEIEVEKVFPLPSQERAQKLA